MILNLSVTKFARNLSDYLNRITYQGDQYRLMRGKKVVAEIRPIKSGRTLGDFLSYWEKMPHLDKRNAESFEKDLKESRARTSSISKRNLWD